jgi:8-oxo-dGTP pyrophosphatase MutT (NUDIX family)
MTDTSNPWTTLSSERRYESHLINLDHEEVRHKSGAPGSYTAIRFKVVGVAVLPVDGDGLVHLVGQYRYVSGVYTWELVRGAGDLQTPAVESARRELKEETGLVAEDWLEILNLMASPGITDERAPCFVAWNTRQEASRPDAQESLARRRVPFSAAVDAALSGEIVDGPSVATILAVHARAASGRLPADLVRLLGAAA